jgi:PLP dependent protein
MTTSPASFADAELTARVAANLADVRRRISEAGRAPDSVRLVAVTKTFGPEVVRAAVAAGLRTLGENYVDELEAKRDATRDLEVRWHFLGALQTNKIARVSRSADVLCAVSRVKELERLSALGCAKEIYLQVDFTGAQGRNGAAPDEVAGLVGRARDLGLALRGLMTVAPIDPAAARAAFLATAGLADRFNLAERSMGMSDDLELALECGSTEVRLGRALFGPRDRP